MTDRLSTIFAALADPTRRAILARLADGDATVSELAEPFPITLPAISRHLKVLERAGLISRSRSAQWRSSTLEVEPLREATAWMEQYRQFWDANFDRLDAHLHRLQRAQSAATPTSPTAQEPAPDSAQRSAPRSKRQHQPEGTSS